MSDPQDKAETPPARIWLLDWPDASATWCQDADPDGEHGDSIEYVRADTRPAPRAGDALVEELAPWADYHGDLPDYDHPLRPVFESGIQYAVELLAKVLGVEGYDVCDGTEEFDGDLGGTLLNIVIKTWPVDEHGDWIDLRDPVTRAALNAQPPADAKDAEEGSLERSMRRVQLALDGAKKKGKNALLVTTCEADLLLAALRSKPEAEAERAWVDACEWRKALRGLLKLHRKMLDAAERQLPYPVSVALDDDDTWAVLTGAIELERAYFRTPTPASAQSPTTSKGSTDMADDKTSAESEFLSDLTSLINRYSRENGSNTPDFMLAEYLECQLRTWNQFVTRREQWHDWCPSDAMDADILNAEQQAFPQTHGGCDDMTLRDWFAGQALAGMLTNENTPFCSTHAECDPSEVAAAVFELADAMLAEREKPQ